MREKKTTKMTWRNLQKGKSVMGIKLKLTGLRRFVRTEAEIADYEAQVAAAQETLVKRTGAGNDFLGWLDLPVNYDREEFARIKQAAAKIQKTCDVLIVIGIGGSYLGARAAIEFVNGQFYNQTRPAGIPEVYFAGNNLSSSYLNDIIRIIGDRDFCINVISKSGTTTEPAIAFRELKKLCEQRYGREGAKERIFATTDKERGALKKLADDEGYETFVVPDDIGGRFSVLTPVGLLPMAAAGLDIDAVMAGAAASREEYSHGSRHDCAKYAALRNLLLFKGKSMEIMVNYEPSLVMLGEWLKQLFDESEGKDHKGLFVTSANFSTDLHSIGQFIQDGSRIMFETVITVREPRSEITIEHTDDDIDGLNYLAGQTVQYVNQKAYEGTLIAHMDGGTPNIVLELDRLDAWHFGYIVYFFEKACGISGYLLGVNPFNQPGVEDYKKNMFALLGKPGFEERRKYLQARVKLED